MQLKAMERITIDAKMDLKEYFRLYIPLIFRNRFILILTYAVAIAVGILLVLNYLDIAISLAVAFILCFIYTISYNYKLVKKTFYSSKGEYGIINYGFTTSQISIETLKFSSILRWKEFIKVEETKRTILLFTSKRTMFIIPKRAISQEQLLNFRNMLVVIPGLKVKLRTTSN